MRVFERNTEDKSQTVRMDLKILFDHMDREGPTEIIVTNITLEDAHFRAWKEKKRRAYKDRAHRFQIRWNWTELGMEDSNRESRESNPHIDGEWHPLWK